MLLLGLTGGIATGKSTIARYARLKGIPIVDADIISREVVRPGEPALDAIVSRFGPDVLLPDGNLDRPKVAALIFANPALRKLMNSFTHVHIRLEMLRQILVFFLLLKRRVILDVPLLFETDMHKWMLPVVVYW